MWVVVGLGNPGKRYSATRHNAGFMLVQRLADRCDAKLKKRRYMAKAAQVDLENMPALLVKPWTYVNRSGLAVQKIVRLTGVKRDRLLVVYDDLDLPLGEIRIRKAGGPGTHKGMMSIVQDLGSTGFPRIRIGIGPLPSGEDPAGFVLANFRREEKPILDECLARAESAVLMVMAEGVESAMNTYNRKVEQRE